MLKHCKVIYIHTSYDLLHLQLFFCFSLLMVVWVKKIQSSEWKQWEQVVIIILWHCRRVNILVFISKTLLSVTLPTQKRNSLSFSGNTLEKQKYWLKKWTVACVLCHVLTYLCLKAGYLKQKLIPIWAIEQNVMFLHWVHILW